MEKRKTGKIKTLIETVTKKTVTMENNNEIS
jgi:hypothetical protein